MHYLSSFVKVGKYATICAVLSLRVHSVDKLPVPFRDKEPLELESGSELAGGNGELLGQDGKLLHFGGV